MDLFPAIDLLDGQCVRLYQGSYDQSTVYHDDPVAQAKSFAAAGARWIHMVDLDAARTGERRNGSVIASVAASVDVPLQVGGGVRDDAAADALLAAGVSRVVVGTAALSDPAWVRRLAARCPGRVAVGLDARGRDVAVRGWTEGSGQDLLDLARSFDDAGIAALVVTEIGRDGTLSGPALDQLAAVLSVTTLDVVASGGVGTLDDLRALATLAVASVASDGDTGAAGGGGSSGTFARTNRDAAGRRLAGVIVGKALYEGAFTVAEAVAAVEAAS